MFQELTLKMVTGLHELNDYTPNVIYNIFFPFQDVIPKITGIAYNGRSYCSGPAEPGESYLPNRIRIISNILFPSNNLIIAIKIKMY